MDRNEIELLTTEVRETFGESSPPVDVTRIAKQEGILLAPGNYGEGFDGRIEFSRTHGKFLLFYPATGQFTRIRFSVGHELAHYYLPAHRQLLIHGKSHNSQSGFICDNELERQADFFAASLLLPRAVLSILYQRKAGLSLKEIVEFSAEWRTSITCTAIRYVETTSCPCSLILSKDKQVRFYIPSEDAAYRGFRLLGKREIPAGSATARASAPPGGCEAVESASVSARWFSPRRIEHEIWEEALSLGYTGLVLTMLSFQVEDAAG